MNTIKHIWEIIAPYFAGGIVGGIITVFIIPIIKGKITKAASGVNALLEKHDAIVKESVNEAVERVKDISFKQSIQPLVESELQKVGEAANAQIENSVKEVVASNARVLGVLEALGAYFDDSVAVTESKKAAFRSALDKAKTFNKTEVITEAVIAPVEEKKTVKKGGGITR